MLDLSAAGMGHLEGYVLRLNLSSTKCSAPSNHSEVAVGDLVVVAERLEPEQEKYTSDIKRLFFKINDKLSPGCFLSLPHPVE